MLEPISLGQGRTHCPGLAADERGVVMGRHLALLFADIARAVGFFRSYSREVNLDEVLASLQIVEVQSERGGREIMVRFEAGGSYGADRAAQAARMHKGRAFTGTERHYLPYRDRRSPLGYDLGGAEEVVSDPMDLTLYTDAGPDRRTLGRTIALKDLILGLSPRPLTQQEKETESFDSLVVRCEKGLAPELARYLWHRQVRATVRTAMSAKKSLFSGKSREIHLVRCENIPRHVAQLLGSTPGMRVFIPVQQHLLVEWGFRHPIALESCGSAFSEEETVLFCGPPAKVERLIVEGEEVDIRDVVDVQLRGPKGVIEPPEERQTAPIEALDVELKLARLPRGSAATQALLIDIERMPWFVKLVYMLPAAVLRSYDAVVADPYIIVINRRGVHGIPFGEPMTEIYPQIFVPVGFQLLPRVDYDLLREHLQIRPEQNLYFFPEEGPAFSVPNDRLKPLSRAVVAEERARMNLREMRTRDVVEELEPTQITHRRQGMFSLWRGTRVDDSGRKQLEAPDQKSVAQLPPKSPAPATPPPPRAGPLDDSPEAKDVRESDGDAAANGAIDVPSSVLPPKSPQRPHPVTGLDSPAPPPRPTRPTSPPSHPTNGGPAAGGPAARPATGPAPSGATPRPSSTPPSAARPQAPAAGRAPGPPREGPPPRPRRPAPAEPSSDVGPGDSG